MTFLRQILKREMAKVEKGEDPIGTIRDAARNDTIVLPMEKNKNNHADGFERYFTRHNTAFAPFAADMLEIMRKYGKRVAAPSVPAE